jgi:hypothetical protein
MKKVKNKAKSRLFSEKKAREAHNTIGATTMPLLDSKFAAAVSNTLAPEWLSAPNEKAFKSFNNLSGDTARI